MKLTPNQLAGLRAVLAGDPSGVVGVSVTTRGPLSGTTQNSLEALGFVRIETRGRSRYAIITEAGRRESLALAAANR